MFMPAEFESHEKLDDWATAKVSRMYLRKWIRKYFKDKEINEKLEFENLEREKLKTVDIIQQEKKTGRVERNGAARKKVA